MNAKERPVRHERVVEMHAMRILRSLPVETIVPQQQCTILAPRRSDSGALSVLGFGSITFNSTRVVSVSRWAYPPDWNGLIRQVDADWVVIWRPHCPRRQAFEQRYFTQLRVCPSVLNRLRPYIRVVLYTLRNTSFARRYIHVVCNRHL